MHLGVPYQRQDMVLYAVCLHIQFIFASDDAGNKILPAVRENDKATSHLHPSNISMVNWIIGIILRSLRDFVGGYLLWSRRVGIAPQQRLSLRVAHDAIGE